MAYAYPNTTHFKLLIKYLQMLTLLLVSHWAFPQIFQCFLFIFIFESGGGAEGEVESLEQFPCQVQSLMQGHLTTRAKN